MGGTLRRHRAGGAEHNLIQSPEIVRRLTSRFKLRQGHVAPVLNEGVQPIVIVDDLREAKEFAPLHTFSGTVLAPGDVTTVPTRDGVAMIVNPVASGVACRVLDVRLYGRNGDTNSNCQIAVGRIPPLGPFNVFDYLEAQVGNAFGHVTGIDPPERWSRCRIASFKTDMGIELSSMPAAFNVFVRERWVLAGVAAASGKREYFWDHGGGPYFGPERACVIVPFNMSPATDDTWVTVMWQEEPIEPGDVSKVT